jgi:formyltetrahydrofolate deformylase
MNEYILLIDTIDAKGLVYKISKVIFEQNLSIEQNSEFVDPEKNKFFMRTVISGNVDEVKLLNALKIELPTESTIKLSQKTKKDIVIMVTKETHCLGDLLIRYNDDELDVNIKAVVSNYETLRPLVEKFDIPYFSVDCNNISREDHEKKMMEIIDNYDPEIIVLAKYMRVLTSAFVQRYEQKILNIHHSFLPAFIGANPYKQAYERGVKIIGATAHIVTNDLDEGPILFQDIARVDHTYSWQDMRKAGRHLEKVALSKALDMLVEDRVFVYGNKTVIL